MGKAEAEMSGGGQEGAAAALQACQHNKISVEEEESASSADSVFSRDLFTASSSSPHFSLSALVLNPSVQAKLALFVG
jgi:hypothetical protein